MTETSKEDLTQENQRDEEVARSIIYSDDFFKKYAELVPEIGERLERYVFAIRDKITSLRQSWEREKAIDAEYRNLMQEALDAIKKEKAGLEERVREYKTEWESALYREQGLKSRNEELEAREYQLRDNKERAYEDAKKINPEYDWGGQTQTAQIAVWGLIDLITRLKAENDRLTASLARMYDLLIWIKKLLPKDQVTLDHIVNNRLHELSHYLLVDFPESIEHALSDPTGQQAFEKWKKMEAVVEDAKKVFSGKLGSFQLKKSLEALDAKEG